MIPVLTAAAAAAVDAASPVPVEHLMRRAGRAVADIAARLGAGYGSTVVVLAGPGNNGGDGYVAAADLAARGARVVVLAWREPRSRAAIDAAALARRAGARLRGWETEPIHADLVIDALFGAGFRGPLPEDVAGWASGTRAPVLAVDVPSGVDASTGGVVEPAFRAVATVTFHALKVAHVVPPGADRCGDVHLVDIGLEGGDAVMHVAEDDDVVLPPRPRRAHKWTSGSVLVAGGSPGLAGAPLLSARAALRAGAGAVRLAVPGRLWDRYLPAAPELLIEPIGDGERLGDDVDALLHAAERFDVLAIGPGLGPGHEALVRQVARRWVRPLVVDADAIGALGLDAPEARQAPTVLTPHGGEFRRLTGHEPTWEWARAFAQAVDAVVVLKGAPTYVTDGDRVVAVTSGGPELATIGSGDVLTGMVGAFIARGVPPMVAAWSAAHRHGRAAAELARSGTVTADRLAEAVGRWAW